MALEWREYRILGFWEGTRQGVLGREPLVREEYLWKQYGRERCEPEIRGWRLGSSGVLGTGRGKLQYAKGKVSGCWNIGEL